MSDEEIYPGFPAPAGFGTIPVEEIPNSTGLELLQRIVRGEYPAPPISRRLDFGLAEAELNRVVFKGLPSRDHYNPLGGVHGGWMATILDSSLACAVMTTLEKGEGYTTVEFKVNLIRPLSEATGEVSCEGLVVSRGRTIAVSEARLTDKAGKILAFGTETCSIFPIEKLLRS